MKLKRQCGATGPGSRGTSAFTMIEIAICLAIIGFALVAIIGILPFGMGVQKDNRHETIINQDATIFLDALRSGAQGDDDLTNYVYAITNYSTRFNRGIPQPTLALGYTRTVSSQASPPTATPTATSPPFPITNGFRIVGLLSTPRIVQEANGGYVSNFVVAYVRSISGPASEKYPQLDPAVQQFALTYRLACDVSPYGANNYWPEWTNFTDARIQGNTNEVAARSNYWVRVKAFETNLHDLRLTFRWPMQPNGQVGPNGQVFRTSVSGALIQTNEPGLVGRHCTIYYFEPRTFFKGT